MLCISYHQIYSKKINFTQMGRYSDSSEQRFRQLFEREFETQSSVTVCREK